MSDTPRTFEEAAAVADSDEFYDRIADLAERHEDPVPGAYWLGIQDGQVAERARLLEGAEQCLRRIFSAARAKGFEEGARAMREEARRTAFNWPHEMLAFAIGSIPTPDQEGGGG